MNLSELYKRGSRYGLFSGRLEETENLITYIRLLYMRIKLKINLKGIQ